MNMFEAGFKVNNYYTQLGTFIGQNNFMSALVVLEELRSTLRSINKITRELNGHPSQPSPQKLVGARRKLCSVCGRELGLTSFHKGSDVCRLCQQNGRG